MISRRVCLQISCCTILLRVTKLRARDGVEPWTAAELMEPAELAASLIHGDSPHIICVAFPVLYRQRHIAGAVLAGPGSKPEGIEALNSELEKLKRSDACGSLLRMLSDAAVPEYTTGIYGREEVGVFERSRVEYSKELPHRLGGQRVSSRLIRAAMSPGRRWSAQI